MTTSPELKTAAASATDLVKTYGSGDTKVVALDEVTVDFRAGEFTAIMGPSGSGKSTLMHCLAGLDAATSGRVRIGEVELTELSDKEMTKLRRDRIGFVFQSYNLVPTLTGAENITLPADIAGREVDQQWYDTVIDRLGIRDRLTHRPSELSGGQQQRVACARALVGRPDIIFGDEPTGNLDSTSSTEVLQIMRAATDEFGQTVVIVTHDPRAASYADRVIFLADGQIVRELRSPTADEIFEEMRTLDEPPAAAETMQTPDPAGTEAAGTEPAGSEAAGTEPAGTETAGTETAGTELGDNDSGGSAAAVAPAAEYQPRERRHRYRGGTARSAGDPPPLLAPTEETGPIPRIEDGGLWTDPGEVR